MLVKAAAVKTQARRVLARPRALLPAILVFLLLCLLGLMHHNGQLQQRISFLTGNSLERDPGRELSPFRSVLEHNN
jgi:hypothetical protein